MGKMKEYLMDLGFAMADEDKTEIHNQLRDGSPNTFRWTVRQMCALNASYDAETGMFLDPLEPELADGYFIGGEGIETSEAGVCFDCWKDLRETMQLVKDPELQWMKMTTSLRDDVWLWRYNPWESLPMLKIPRCGCGNWIWVKAGHDALFEQVAKRQMTPELATRFVNRSFSYELDTRSFNRGVIDNTIENWDTRWLD